MVQSQMTTINFLEPQDKIHLDPEIEKEWQKTGRFLLTYIYIRVRLRLSDLFWHPTTYSTKHNLFISQYSPV